jgi:hypothetical protein
MNKYVLIIEPTNYCTARCTTCITHKSKAPKGFMSIEVFRKILVQSKDLLIEAVQLNGQGEGMMHPEWEQLPKIVREYYPNIETRLITNGSIYKKVPKEVDNFQVSFNGGTKEVYERITNLGFASVLSNIQQWKKDGVMDKGSIHMLVFKDNEHTVENFKRLFVGYNLEFSYKYDNQCGDIEDKTCEEQKFKYKGKIPCTYVTQVIYITWDGYVLICPHDVNRTEVYGNIKDFSPWGNILKDIIYGLRRSSDEEIHKRKNFDYFDICKNCNFNMTE